MTSKSFDTLLRYGISTELAAKATSAGLTVVKLRSLSQRDLIEKFKLIKLEAVELSRLAKRDPIVRNVADTLLKRSNYLCNVCKGMKSSAYIIHHIEEYEKSQDNTYKNLIVLCPNDHDLAHRRGALTLGITPAQLRKSKRDWEKTVELENVRRAAQSVDVVDTAIDYVNIKRIEELCRSLFKRIPDTSAKGHLQRKRILDRQGSFDQKYVQRNLSGGRYLFDYMNNMETDHYKELLQQVAERVQFSDLDVAAGQGHGALEALEGKYAFFIGGLVAKGPDLPISPSTPPVLLRYRRKGLVVEWALDPMFLMSMSAMGRIGGKNRYIVYCLVRSVDKDEGGNSRVAASPLLIAQPHHYIDKTPHIAYKKRFEAEEELEDLDQTELE